MSQFRAILTTVSIGASILLLGCTQQQQQQDDNSSVLVQQPTIGINLGTGVMYPSGFPLAQYPGSKINTSTSNGSRDVGMTTRAVVLTSGDDIYKVGQFYQNELLKAGWEIKDMTASTNLLSMNAEKGKARAVVTVSPAGGKFSVGGVETGVSSIQLVITSK